MIRALLIIVAGVVLISCAITPPLFYFIEQTWQDFPWPYSRVFDRVILLVAVILIYTQRKNLRLPPFTSMFGSSGRWKQFLLLGFLVAAGSALAVMPIVVSPDHGLGWGDRAPWSVWAGRIGKVFLTAVAVSLLEELIFRGVIYSSVRQRLSHYPAAMIISLVYAVVHFLAPNKGFVVDTWNPVVGFQYFATLLTRLVEPGIVSGLFGLWLVGMVLCEAVYRTRGLYLSLGLHAGWIFAAKWSLYLTTELPGTSFPSALGRRYFLVGTPEVWVTILVAWALVFALGRLASSPIAIHGE